MDMSTTRQDKRSLILAGILLSTFLAAIEGTVVGPAGPAIIGNFGSVSLMSWIFTSYLLTMAVTTPIFGKISDLYGRKPVFLFGSVLFLAGSLLCGFSQSMTQLIAFRAIQGIGAGAVIPVTFTIIGDIYSLQERGKVQGLLSSVWGISSLVGPLLGGYFVDYLSWRWIFGFNVPFALISIWLIYRYLHEKREPRKVQIDYAGAVLFTFGMTLLLFALAVGGQTYPWTSPMMIGILAVSVVLLALFLRVETRAPEPMVPLRLFRIRDITVSTIANMLVSALLIGLTTYLPLWIQGVRGGGATLSGLSLAPMSIGWLFGSVASGRLLVKTGSRKTALLGVVGLAVGAVGLAFMQDDTPLILILACTFVYGLGFGYISTLFSIIAQSSVGYQLRGASTALTTFIRTLGQTVGVAVFGTWLNTSIARRIAEQPSAGGIHVDDVNRLLSPHGEVSLPGETGGMLKQVLEGSLSSLFVFMAILALACFVVVARYNNRPPEPEDGGEQPAASTGGR